MSASLWLPGEALVMGEDAEVSVYTAGRNPEPLGFYVDRPGSEGVKVSLSVATATAFRDSLSEALARVTARGHYAAEGVNR